MLRAAFILIVLLIFVALFSPSGPQAMLTALPHNDVALAIVVNKSNSIDNVSLMELRKIFMMEQHRWPNGQRVTVLMREPGQVERATVLRLIYRMSERDFTRHFLRGTFTGETQSVPKTLNTGASVRKFILNVPGAIGYLRAGEVDDSVKIVRVGGRASGDAGYLLKMPG